MSKIILDKSEREFWLGIIEMNFNTYGLEKGITEEMLNNYLRGDNYSNTPYIGKNETYKDMSDEVLSQIWGFQDIEYMVSIIRKRNNI